MPLNTICPTLFLMSNLLCIVFDSTKARFWSINHGYVTDINSVRQILTFLED